MEFPHYNQLYGTRKPTREREDGYLSFNFSARSKGWRKAMVASRSTYTDPKYIDDDEVLLSVVVIPLGED